MLEKLGTRQSLSILLMSWFLASCQSGPRLTPTMQAQIWAGHSVSGAIVRDHTGESISCREVRFDDFMCIPYADYELILRSCHED